MSSKEKPTAQLLRRALDLIVLRPLETMESQHAYQIAGRLGQVSDRLLKLNQGTLDPVLVRLEQYGSIKGSWAKTQNNREARFYNVARAGALTTRSTAMPDLLWRLFVEGTQV